MSQYGGFVFVITVRLLDISKIASKPLTSKLCFTSVWSSYVHLCVRYTFATSYAFSRRKAYYSKVKTGF